MVFARRTFRRRLQQISTQENRPSAVSQDGRLDQRVQTNGGCQFCGG
jgi:hypothetical protein